jgi:hypothetical protein
MFPLLIDGWVGKLVKPPVPSGIAVPVPRNGAKATVRLVAQSPTGQIVAAFATNGGGTLMIKIARTEEQLTQSRIVPRLDRRLSDA